MAKITERVLKEYCITANSGVLKVYPYGLSVERRGPSGFVVSRRYRDVNRKPGEEQLVQEPLSAREAMVFMEGFLAGVVPIELSSHEHEKDLLYGALLKYDGPSMCPDWDAKRKRDLTAALDRLRAQLLTDL